MEKITTKISETVKDTKTGKNVRKEIGNVEYLVPTLADFGITSATEIREEPEKELDYKEPAFSWLFSAIISACRATLTSRLQPQSVEYKQGQSAWTTLEELITSSGGAKGAHFVIKREFTESFSAYIKSLGKSPAWTAAMQGLGVLPTNTKATPALAESTAGNKAVFLKHLTNYFEQLSAEDKIKFAAIFTDLCDLCETVTTSLEDE